MVVLFDHYFIPNGIYQVSNVDNRGVQISVYSGLPVKVNGWDEFVMDNNCSRPIVLMPGQNKELEIKEGQFIVLSDGSSNIFFIKI